jgi:hypothetical protein
MRLSTLSPGCLTKIEIVSAQVSDYLKGYKLLPHERGRYPTQAGRETLAKRLQLPHPASYEQDWEWEFANPAYFKDWVEIYRSEPLNEDERISLMEMLVQCVEDLADDLSLPVDESCEWQQVAALLLANPRLHAQTIEYWSALQYSEKGEYPFRVTSSMRRIRASV